MSYGYEARRNGGDRGYSRPRSSFVDDDRNGPSPSGNYNRSRSTGGYGGHDDSSRGYGDDRPQRGYGGSYNYQASGGRDHDHQRGQQHGCQGLRITVNYDFNWGGHGDFSFSGGGYDSGRSGDYGLSSGDHKRRRLGGDRDDFSGRGYRCSDGGYGPSSGLYGGASGHDNRGGYGGASGGYEQSRSGYGGGGIAGYGGGSGVYDNRSRGHGGGNEERLRGYGGRVDRGDQRKERRYGAAGRGGRGYGAGAGSSGDRGYGASGVGRSDDRGYGGGRVSGGYGGINRGGGQSGGGGPRGQEGSGYEQIGQPIANLRIQDEESGRAGVREARADDADLQQEVQICRRPGVAQRGKTTQLKVNYFGISLDSVVPEIFKYHLTVERSPVVSTNTPPRSEARPERTLVRNVIIAALRQYEAEFDGIRVVHDGMAALYSPTKLPWNTKDFAGINPDSTGAPAPPQQPPAAGGAGAPRHGPRTFVVKMKLVETIATSSLSDYCENPDVNVEPALQALDVVVRHLAVQRLTAVRQNFFTMRNPYKVKGGKEICRGYHQEIHVANDKLMMNIDPTATVFYSPGGLMEVAMAALRARDPNDVRDLSMRDLKSLARALSHIEVAPTHRRDRARAICGISAHPADRTMVDIQGENMSVAAYFRVKYKMQLRYPNLPLVNVGSKRPGKEAWLPIEVCVVAPAQHCANMTDLDSADIVRQTSYPPPIRQEKIMEQVRQTGFVNDPFLAAFGIKVGQGFKCAEAHVIDTPTLLFKNVSERPTGGQWSINGKKFVEGVPVRNWGVIVAANVRERDVHDFIGKLTDSGDQCGLPFEDKNPVLILQDQHRGAQVGDLMKMCHQALERRNAGPPQFLLVILPTKNSPLYGDVKRMSNTVLGLPSQCIVSQNLPRANPQLCANVCLTINAKLKGMSHMVLDELPLIARAPTIIIGVDVEKPGDRSSVAAVAVVASVDRYAAQYATRMAAQKASGYIQHLPSMLRELFLVYYEKTEHTPEHVVYYRHGVSEDRMFETLQTEMRALREAFKMISDDYNPPVTFVVANTSHYVRAFPVNPRDADRKGNVMPGTVIDTDVVNPHRFDFFLYGHGGIKGTTVPAHYTVLYDENKMPADDIQRLTYHLGYMVSHRTRSVSFAAPVYYANLAVARIRDILSSPPTFDFTGMHENMLDCMFYL